MNTTAAPNFAHAAPSDLYDPDEVIPRNSPLFEATNVVLRPSPSPPPHIPPPQVSPSFSTSGRKTKRGKFKVRPSQGDAVLVSFMDSGRRPDIASLAGTQALPSDTSEEASTHDGSDSSGDEDELMLKESNAQAIGHEKEQALSAIRNINMSNDPPAPPEAGSAMDALKSLAAGAMRSLMLKDTNSESDNGPTPPTAVESETRPENGQNLEISQISLVRRDGLVRDGRPQPLAPSQSPYSDSYSPHQVGSILANKHDPRSPTTSLTERGSLPPIHMSPRTDSNGPILPSIRDQLGDFRQLEVQSPAFSHHSPGVPRIVGGHGSPPVSPQDFRQHNPMSPGQSIVPHSPYYPVNGIYQQRVSVEYSSSNTETPSTDHSGSTPATQTSVADRMSIDGAAFNNPEGIGAFICKFPGCKAPPFQTQYLLNSHANVHSSARPHYCPVKGCPRSEGGKGFKRKNEMIRHGLVHDSPGYVCPFCPDREHKYPRPDNLQRHVRVHHVDKDKDDPLLRDVLAQRPDGPSRGRRRRGVAN